MNASFHDPVTLNPQAGRQAGAAATATAAAPAAALYNMHAQLGSLSLLHFSQKKIKKNSLHRIEISSVQSSSNHETEELEGIPCLLL